MIGVMNSTKNPGILKSDGKCACRKLISKPLMWDPSWSWSVMIMMWPYRRLFTLSYAVPCRRPKICLMYVISALFMIWSCDASLTFKSFPRSGKTPYRSRPTTDKPLTASAFAESPSVKINVQCSEFLPPASLASSSLGIPVRRVFFAPSCFFSSLDCLNEAQERICSTTPLVIIFFIVVSAQTYLLPKFAARVFSVSLVCESNAGFSISALTKTQRWFLTCVAFKFLQLFSFFLIFSRSFDATSSATALTCVPPSS